MWRSNPVEPIIGAVGDAASTTDPGTFDNAMRSIWSFAVVLLGGVLSTIDRYAMPSVDPTAGPLAGLLPMSMWLGAAVLVVMAFVQIGKAVVHRGRGFGRILVGLAQYIVVSVAGIGVLATVVAASDSLAKAILQVGLNVESWRDVGGDDAVLTTAADGVPGVGLGLIALLCVVPGAIGLLLEVLVRNAAILVLAAMVPILAGGLVADATRRWFWTAARWMLALVFMTPGIACTLVVGVRIAQAAVGEQADPVTDPGQATVAATVSGLVFIVALICPLALFRLFAFVDPNSLSGAAVRGLVADRAGGGGAGGGGGGAGSAGSTEEIAESDVDGRFEHALATLPDPADVAAPPWGEPDDVGGDHPGYPPPPFDHAQPAGTPPGTGTFPPTHDHGEARADRDSGGTGRAAGDHDLPGPEAMA